MNNLYNVVESLELHNKRKKITSLELLKVINYFRGIESKILNTSSRKLKHSDLVIKIRKEIGILEALGLKDAIEVELSENTDDKGRTRYMYILNRDAMIYILTSESTIMRAKITEYLSKLEDVLEGR